VSPHKRKTSFDKRLYIEVKCELACSLVMLAEPNEDQRRQNCTYSEALPKAMYHVYLDDKHDILDVQERGISKTEARDS
jgi:hypothetical protein